MPQNKLQEFVFTTIMAMFMVYGMICYNVASVSYTHLTLPTTERV